MTISATGVSNVKLQDRFQVRDNNGIIMDHWYSLMTIVRRCDERKKLHWNCRQRPLWHWRQWLLEMALFPALICPYIYCFKMFQVSIPHFSKRESAMDSTDEGGLSALAVEYAPFESFWHFWLLDSLLMLELHQVSLERWELQQNASDLAEGGQKHDQRVMRVMCSIVSRYFLFILTYWFYWDTMGY